jgi:hypothetical protein
MWLLPSLAAALFQVLRNTTMKRLGHALDEYINGRRIPPSARSAHT